MPLEKRVLEQTCRQAKGWQDQRLAEETTLSLSVNLSARQFRHPSLYKAISDILQSKGLEAGILILDHRDRNGEGDERRINQLRKLKTLGIKLAVDDFGTGYSSLSYLSRFPVDYLKIDRSFVGDLDKKSEARKLVSGILDLPSSLELRVIAEGIETA